MARFQIIVNDLLVLDTENRSEFHRRQSELMTEKSEEDVIKIIIIDDELDKI